MADTAMVEAPRCVLLLGPLSHTAHIGCGAADGRPGELRGGNRNALAALLALPIALCGCTLTGAIQ